MRGRVFLVVALQGFSLGAFSYRGTESDFSVFLLQIGRRSVSWSCFHLLKVKCCGQTSRETRKLLKSSLEFFSGGLFRFEEKGWIFGFCLAFWGGIPTSRVENEV